MPAAERQKASAKAEALLEQVRKSPAQFAELAKKNSDDPGSAERGGDLDFFGRGAMVKPFEDAVFAMKPGEISNVVETEFGFHIIQLTAQRGGEKKSFDSVRAEIEDEVSKQLAQKRYAEAAEQFTNTVYEQSDSLQPVIDKLKLEKRTATVQRTPAPAPPARWRRPSCSTRCSATTRCATSATPMPSKSGPTSWPRRASSSTRRRARCRWPKSRTGCASAWWPRRPQRWPSKDGQAMLAQAAEGRPTWRCPTAPSSGARRHRACRATDRCGAAAPSRQAAGAGGRGPGRAGLRGRARSTQVLPRDPALAQRADPAVRNTRRPWPTPRRRPIYGALKKRYKAEVKASALAADAAPRAQPR